MQYALKKLEMRTNVLNIKGRPVLYCSIRLCVCVSAVKQEEIVLTPALDDDDYDDYYYINIAFAAF